MHRWRPGHRRDLRARLIGDGHPQSADHAYRLYVAGETRAASAAESVVGSNGFGELLATSASNAMAVARIANGGADRGVRMLRVAGRADSTSLARYRRLDG